MECDLYCFRNVIVRSRTTHTLWIWIIVIVIGRMHLTNTKWYIVWFSWSTRARARRLTCERTLSCVCVCNKHTCRYAVTMLLRRCRCVFSLSSCWLDAEPIPMGGPHSFGHQRRSQIFSSLYKGTIEQYQGGEKRLTNIHAHRIWKYLSSEHANKQNHKYKLLYKLFLNDIDGIGVTHRLNSSIA